MQNLEQLSTIVLRGQLHALNHGKEQIMTHLSALDAEISEYERILHVRELELYRTELAVMKKIVDSYHSDRKFFNDNVAETHRVSTGIVYLFKTLDRVYMEVEERPRTVHDTYPPNLSRD